jgi:hypothetical protein
MTALLDGDTSMIWDSCNLDSCAIPGEQVIEIDLDLTRFQANWLWETVMNGLHYFDLSEESGAQWARFEVGLERSPFDVGCHIQGRWIISIKKLPY